MDDHFAPPFFAANAAGPAAWQRALAEGITQPSELLELLELDPALGLDTRPAFPLRVPRDFVAKMRKGDPLDPLFLQVWPSAAESIEVPGFSDDAVGDLAKLKPGGLIHKYHGRALVIATGACAVHCRYCFRQHFPYSDALAARGAWRETLAQIAGDESINEVILSGGDPLALTDDKLAIFARALEDIPHLRRLRLHTRVPVVLPERVDERFLGWFGSSRLQKVVVLHCNHANEVDESVAQAVSRMKNSGATVLNQAVLLKGVNDSVPALASLSERLFASGVVPYYLHLLDRVRGAGHFEVDESTAIKLMRTLTEILPGYLMPRLVREMAGAPAKVLLPW